MLIVKSMILQSWQPMRSWQRRQSRLTAGISWFEEAAKEAGVAERTVVVEFPSYDAALSTYQSDAYQAALEKLADGVVRDFRIVEGSE